MSSSSADAVVVALTHAGSALTQFPLALAAEKNWSKTKPKNKLGEIKLFYDVEGKTMATVSLGKEAKDENGKAEAARTAAAAGARALKEAGCSKIAVDVAAYPHAAAEGAHLAVFEFNHLKTKKENTQAIDILPLDKSEAIEGDLGWETGIIYAYSQNLARELMELPANIMTPTVFCDRITKEFEGIANTEIQVHDEAWAEKKGMRTFLSVTKGTDEPAKFIELHYNGAKDSSAAPLAFVGKGITFDSGGISLKPAADMKLMRGDMGGAATLFSAALAIAKLKIPMNLIAVAPLTENLPGPKANKPGDIVYAMNGKTVEIDNTDAEGRLILSDALYYVTSEYKPHTVLDCATLTGAMVMALGTVYSGVFTNSESLWNELHVSGEAEHDRFWRMPLDDDYLPQISNSNADLMNTGAPKSAGSCTAAMFLKAFVDGLENEDGSEGTIRWAHIDIAGTMEAVRPSPYQNKGMTGRGTRAFIEFARRLAGKQ